MRQLTVTEFRSSLKASVEAVAESHIPLRVTRRGGEDFVVLSAADWECLQETLYVLQNRSLMEQISRSLRARVEPAGAPSSADLMGTLRQRIQISGDLETTGLTWEAGDAPGPPGLRSGSDQ